MLIVYFSDVHIFVDAVLELIFHNNLAKFYFKKQLSIFNTSSRMTFSFGDCWILYSL